MIQAITMPSGGAVTARKSDHGPQTASGMRISVIMPIYNAARFLTLSLPPLVQALRAAEIDEIIAVDDSSTDNSAELAAQLGAQVIHSGGRLGPGAARNIAARVAVGDVLWFVDSDVVAHQGGPRRIRDAMSTPEVWAIFGSYDDLPAELNFGSQYKNLLHHHHHQVGKAEAVTFWAGCGAVRREKFLALGGFDAARYPRPSIEDIELGYRIRKSGGRIKLDRGFLSKHLKYWTVPELVRVDIWQRAIPWTRLMLGQGPLTDDLNVSRVERIRAGLAGLIALSPFTAALSLTPWWTPFPLLLLALAANVPLFQTFAKKRGIFFGLRAIGFHQIYYIYCAAVFVGCWLEAKLSGRQSFVK